MEARKSTSRTYNSFLTFIHLITVVLRQAELEQVRRERAILVRLPFRRISSQNLLMILYQAELEQISAGKACSIHKKGQGSKQEDQNRSQDGSQDRTLKVFNTYRRYSFRG